MLVNNGVAKNIIICLHVALNCCCKKLLCNKHATNSTQRNVEKKMHKKSKYSLSSKWKAVQNQFVCIHNKKLLKFAAVCEK